MAGRHPKQIGALVNEMSIDVAKNIGAMIKVVSINKKKKINIKMN